MKTIKLTAEEIRWLNMYLWYNPCRSTCMLGKQPRYDCYDRREDGTYKCPLQRAGESIYDKINGTVLRSKTDEVKMQ